MAHRSGADGMSAARPGRAVKRARSAARLAIWALALAGCGGPPAWPEPPPKAGSQAPPAGAEPEGATPPEDAALKVLPDDADTPARRQLTWVLDQLARPEAFAPGPAALTEAEVEAHLAPDFVRQLPPAKLIEVLGTLATQFGPLGARSTVGQTEHRLALRVELAQGAVLAAVAVESAPPHRMTELTFRPAPKPEDALPRTWAAIDTALAGLAEHTHLYVARLDPAAGTCTPIHAANAERAAPIGSTFKLYVLAALADAVARGERRWEDTLAIRDDWKSLPSGKLQDAPAGTTLDLGAYADNMIAISDNTATDHLLHHLGRAAVEATVKQSGHHAPERLRPFLSTQEFFKLKLLTDDVGRAAWLAKDEAARRAWLATEQVKTPLPPLAQLPRWAAPVAIEDIEWFATGADLCRLSTRFAAGAEQPAWARALRSLALNPGGLSPDEAHWRWLGYKGGSEPGVLFLQWLAQHTDGTWYSLSLGIWDRAKAIDVPALVELGRASLLVLQRAAGERAAGERQP